MNVSWSGAGVAGVSVVQLLRRQGLHPVLPERSASSVDEGYMLGLMPLVDEPSRRLEVWSEYREWSARDASPFRRAY